VLDKLKLIEDRYEELNRLMADPDVVTDHTKVTEYAQEQAEIADMVQAYRRYKALEQELEDTRALIEMEDDPEMLEGTEQELARIEEGMAALYDRMKLMLLPKDPNDERNVIVEIRAGAGGDEAGIFAADLYRMYTRYAESKGWKTQILSEHRTGARA